jgi:hypothetical protein
MEKIPDSVLKEVMELLGVEEETLQQPQPSYYFRCDICNRVFEEALLITVEEWTIMNRPFKHEVELVRESWKFACGHAVDKNSIEDIDPDKLEEKEEDDV